MEQPGYQPVQYNGIVPQLSVPDFVRPFAESQERLAMGEKQSMETLQANQATELANLQSSFRDSTEAMEGLAKLSTTVASTLNDVRVGQYQRAYNDQYFKTKKMAKEERTKLAQQQKAEEAQLSSEAGQAAGQVNKVVQKTPVLSGTMQHALSLSGARRIAALNAISSARLQQYPQYLDDYVKARNPQTPAEYAAAQAEAEESWAQQTGMNQANAGYLSLHVFPTIDKANAAGSEKWTRQYNVSEGEKSRVATTSSLKTQSTSLNDAWKVYTSTTAPNGNGLFSNAQTGEAINKQFSEGVFDRSHLNAWGKEINPVTKKPWSEHPMYAQWVNSERAYRIKAKDQEVKVQKQQIRDLIYATDGSTSQIAGVYEKADELGIPRALVAGEVSTYLNSSTENYEEKVMGQTVGEKIEENPDYVMTPQEYDGLSYTDQQRFEKNAPPERQEEGIQAKVLNDPAAKSLDKDVKNLIYSVSTGVKRANPLTGASGPINEEAYAEKVKGEIITRASQLLLRADNTLTPAQAIEQAKQDWLEDKKELTKNGAALKEYYDKDTNSFVDIVPTGITYRDGKIVAQELQGATLDKITGLHAFDLEYRNNTATPRVQYLADKFGLTPLQIINRARSQQGMKPLVVPGQSQGEAQIPQTDIAALRAVTNPAVQTQLRAQLNSGQALSGTPEQRAVAVGRQLLSLGYKGIWQNKFFNYENGYVPEGGQEVAQRTYDSKHNQGQGKALDIGIAANGEQKLDTLYLYLYKNRKKFGITELLWKTPGHYDHIHVGF